jgi:hypothetical protein
MLAVFRTAAALRCVADTLADASPVLVEHVGETNALLDTTKGPHSRACV